LFKFPTKNIFAPIASRIVAGDALDSFASAYTHYKKALESNAIIETNLIKGKVVHVDNFGNIITDVHKTLIERFAKDIPFTIYYRNKDYYIEEISATYNSVPVGEKVALFNDRGFLEIAINRGANGSNGGAEKLFGVRIGDVVRVEFTPKGSHTTLDSLF
jgi:S-adenosylmethionine hydrolase